MAKFTFQLFNFDSLDIDEIIRLLPNHFSLIRKEGDTFLTVIFDDAIDEKEIIYLIDREFDRIYFLTGCKIDFSLIHIMYSDGRQQARCEIKYSINAIQKIPDNIGPQQWENNIDTQLKLWRLAHEDNIALGARVNLLFQIIEIEYPDNKNYPEYNDPKLEPSPMTEAKLLRHIVSHGKSPIKSSQLRKYCKFLGLRAEMHDPANPKFVDAINRRLPVITNLAKEIIEAKLTKI